MAILPGDPEVKTPRETIEGVAYRLGYVPKNACVLTFQQVSIDTVNGGVRRMLVGDHVIDLDKIGTEATLHGVGAAIKSNSMANAFQMTYFVDDSTDEDTHILVMEGGQTLASNMPLRAFGIFLYDANMHHGMSMTCPTLFRNMRSGGDDDEPCGDCATVCPWTMDFSSSDFAMNMIMNGHAVPGDKADLLKQAFAPVDDKVFALPGAIGKILNKDQICAMVPPLTPEQKNDWLDSMADPAVAKLVLAEVVLDGEVSNHQRDIAYDVIQSLPSDSIRRTVPLVVYGVATLDTNQNDSDLAFEVATGLDPHHATAKMLHRARGAGLTSDRISAIIIRGSLDA